MAFFKDYFKVFFINYLLLVASKLLFSFYLGFNEVYAVFWGYKFDFAVSAFVAFVVMLFSFNQKLARVLFVLLSVVFFNVQIADILYFAESQRHIGYEASDFFVDMVPLVSTALHKFFWMTIVAVLLSIVLAYMLWRVRFSYQAEKYFAFKLLGALGISVFFIRGEFQHIPLHPYQANEIGDVKEAQVALNGVYNMVYALIQAKKEPHMLQLPSPSKELIQKSFSELYPEKRSKVSLPVIEGHPNVILFFAESWSAHWLKPYGYDKETTPNFDRFYKEGLKVRYMVANGHRTTEGIFATLTSFPNPLGKSVAKTSLQSFSYDSMIFLFNEAGYESMFFQGTSKDTSGTGSLAQSLGFHKSYGKRDIDSRKYPLNYWGVQDDDLYDFVLQKLPTKKPFIIGINGATTHDIVVPGSFEKRHFVDDEKLNDQLNALYFADYSLGRFVKKVKERFPDTLFVFFADHCGGGLSGTLQNYKIPFVVFGKGIEPGYKDVVLSQMDIAPTVVDLVLGDYKKLLPNATGKSLVSDSVFFAPYFHSGILGWVEARQKIEMNLQNAQTTCEATDKECNRLRAHMLSYTYVTQKLLFEGKSREFHMYRTGYKRAESFKENISRKKNE